MSRLKFPFAQAWACVASLCLLASSGCSNGSIMRPNAYYSNSNWSAAPVPPQGMRPSASNMTVEQFLRIQPALLNGGSQFQGRAPYQQVTTADFSSPQAAQARPVGPVLVPESRYVETEYELPLTPLELINRCKGPAEIVEYLNSGDAQVQNRAAEALLERGATGRAKLVEVMESGSSRARAAALWGLRNKEPTVAELERLAAGLQDGDPVLRRVSVRVAGMWGSPGSQSQLIDALADSNESVRQAAGEALAHLGPSVVPALVEQLSAPEERARDAASQTLIRVGGAAVPPLHEALADKTPGVRFRAAHSLGNLGRAAMPALPTLEKMAESDPDSTVRYYAAAACRKLHR